MSKAIIIGAAVASLFGGFITGVLTESGFHDDAFTAAKRHYEPICVASLTSTPEEAMKGVSEGEKSYVVAFCTAYLHGAEFANANNVVSHP